MVLEVRINVVSVNSNTSAHGSLSQFCIPAGECGFKESAPDAPAQKDVLNQLASATVQITAMQAVRKPDLAGRNMGMQLDLVVEEEPALQSLLKLVWSSKGQAAPSSVGKITSSCLWIHDNLYLVMNARKAAHCSCQLGLEMQEKFLRVGINLAPCHRCIFCTWMIILSL